MKPKDYIEQSGATDYREYTPVTSRMEKELNARLMHYSMGISTEAGEILDQLKKVFIYGKELDTVNLKEELGDVLWYVARMCDTLGFTFEEIMQLNVDKLKARYGDRFTEHAALNRDVEKEREVLESGAE